MGWLAVRWSVEAADRLAGVGVRNQQNLACMYTAVSCIWLKVPFTCEVFVCLCFLSVYSNGAFGIADTAGADCPSVAAGSIIASHLLHCSCTLATTTTKLRPSSPAQPMQPCYSIPNCSVCNTICDNAESSKSCGNID
jgi:hypothetical protein